MNKQKTILIVDDTKANIHILAGLLGDDYSVMAVRSGFSAIEIVAEEKIDLILLDIMMPEMDGYEVCEILKSQKETKNIPILFITTKADEDSIEQAYDVGGVDYVTKPFKPKELLARIRTHLKLSETLKTLEYIATRDSMTSIYNRRKFFELAENAFAQRMKLFAVMIDIDKFKNINDTYGHQFGDIVIKNMTGIISNIISDGDIFGRLGGEEFSIVFEDYSEERIKEKVEEIRVAVEKMKNIYHKDTVGITVSIGVAKKDQFEIFDMLLSRADEALYDAKRTGRNKVCFRL